MMVSQEVHVTDKEEVLPTLRTNVRLGLATGKSGGNYPAVGGH